eukprot:gene2392-3190_t
MPPHKRGRDADAKDSEPDPEGVDLFDANNNAMTSAAVDYYLDGSTVAIERIEELLLYALTCLAVSKDPSFEMVHIVEFPQCVEALRMNAGLVVLLARWP